MKGLLFKVWDSLRHLITDAQRSIRNRPRVSSDVAYREAEDCKATKYEELSYSLPKPRWFARWTWRW